MTTKTIRRAIIPMLASVAATAAAADTTYVSVDIGSLGSKYTIADAVNNKGHAVGSSITSGANPTTHAFLWRSGVMTDLGVPAADCMFSEATAINNNDQIVGEAVTTTGEYIGWIWQNGTFKVLPFWHIGGINDSGVVVGAESVAAGSWHLVTWQAGTVTDLGDVGGDNLWPEGINASGGITGWRSEFHLTAFMTYNDTFRTTVDIGNPHTNNFAFAKAINNAGWVVGQDTFEYTPNGYTWDAFMWLNGKFTQLPALVPGQMSSAWSINNSNAVVGYSWIPPSREDAVLWESGAVSDLNDRLSSGPGAGDLQIAVGINDSGQILVNGNLTLVNNGASVVQHAYLLTPAAATPAPSLPKSVALGITATGSISSSLVATIAGDPKG